MIKSLLFFKKTITSNTKDIEEIIIDYLYLTGYYSEEDSDRDINKVSVVARCLLIKEERKYQFCRYIKRIEKEWLIATINSFLEKQSLIENC